MCSLSSAPIYSHGVTRQLDQTPPPIRESLESTQKQLETRTRRRYHEGSSRIQLKQQRYQPKTQLATVVVAALGCACLARPSRPLLARCYCSHGERSRARSQLQPSVRVRLFCITVDIAACVEQRHQRGAGHRRCWRHGSRCCTKCRSFPHHIRAAI